jgi:OOP family OmpA-OmpF porin
MKLHHACLALCLVAPAALAQQTAPAASAKPTVLATAAPAAAAPAAAAPSFLKVYFNLGSAQVRPEDQAVLDQASRTYRVGQPIVMVLTGSTDATGPALANLDLSERRAATVLQALVARGIPAEKFQVLAKGETELAVPDPTGQPELRNRSVEISWR